MENFFYEEHFCSDLSDLMDVFDIDEDNLKELEEDWIVKIEEASLEKIFVLKKEFVTDAIVRETDTWEERFPEESDHIFDKIKKAISESIDIEKMNELLPSLYYSNGNKSVITKHDLVEWCK